MFMQMTAVIKESESRVHESNKLSTQTIDTLHSKSNSWVRLWARQIDLFIFAMTAPLLETLPSSIIEYTAKWEHVLFLLLWAFIESIFLSSWGTTFGKWLLNVKVRDKEGKKLTFPRALTRSLLVWGRGCGFGLHPISMVMPIIERKELNKNGITSWDKALNLVVNHEHIGSFRITVAMIILALQASLFVIYIFNTPI